MLRLPLDMAHISRQIKFGKTRPSLAPRSPQLVLVDTLRKWYISYGLVYRSFIWPKALCRDNTFLPRFTKLANPRRESISSILLRDPRSAGRLGLSNATLSYRFCISLAHVISLSGGAFRDAPRIPRTTATSASMIICT